jgi:signal transduction histidine kinase
MLQQAIANLVDNAVKFSPDHATVRVTASVSAAVLIAVDDKGPGIPLQDREKATDRFYRGEAARSTPGSGLGLSLVLAVAQLHGGRCRCRRRPRSARPPFGFRRNAEHDRLRPQVSRPSGTFVVRQPRFARSAKTMRFN